MYFTSDYVQFFQELAANNNRDWFHDNKKRYENSVKKPFAAFVTDLIAAINEHQEITITPKQAIFRIHRDIRFSKDKTPYKLYCSAVVSKGGRKDHTDPHGLYVEISPEHLKVYGGMWNPTKEQLYLLRQGIAGDLAGFKKAISDKDFVKYFGEIQGDKNKRIPKEFKEAAEKQPLIFNKSMYFFSDVGIKHIESDNLMGLIMERYHAKHPVCNFFYDALHP